LFTLLYTLFFAASAIYFHGRPESRKQSRAVVLLTYIAYLGGLCDFVENTFFSLFTFQYPTRYDFLVPFVSTITILKYGFFFFNILSVLVGFVRKMWGVRFKKE